VNAQNALEHLVHTLAFLRRALHLSRLHVALVATLNLDVDEHRLDERGNAVELLDLGQVAA
jgi:hypothetical protein